MFVQELRSNRLNDLVMKLYRSKIIKVGKGERTLQMYCCFHLLSKLFWSEKANWRFRPIIVEESALKSGSDIGDIMLPSDMEKDQIDVWVEIKNFFGKETITNTMLRSLTRDYEKCDSNHQRGGKGVVLFTFDDKIMGETLVQDLSNRFPKVTTIVIGGI